MFRMRTTFNWDFCDRLCTLLKGSRSLIHVSWVLWGLSGGGWELVASWRPFMWLEPCLSPPTPWLRPSSSPLLSPQSSYVISLWHYYGLLLFLLFLPCFLGSFSLPWCTPLCLCSTSYYCIDISTYLVSISAESVPHSLMSDLIAFVLTLGTV